MKTTFLICSIAAPALIGLSCTSEATLEVSVTETDDGVVIEHIGDADCDQRFELAIGESVTVTDMSQPIKVSVVSLRDKYSHRYYAAASNLRAAVEKMLEVGKDDETAN